MNLPKDIKICMNHLYHYPRTGNTIMSLFFICLIKNKVKSLVSVGFSRHLMICTLETDTIYYILGNSQTNSMQLWTKMLTRGYIDSRVLTCISTIINTMDSYQCLDVSGAVLQPVSISHWSETNQLILNWVLQTTWKFSENWLWLRVMIWDRWYNIIGVTAGQLQWLNLIHQTSHLEMKVGPSNVMTRRRGPKMSFKQLNTFFPNNLYEILNT